MAKNNILIVAHGLSEIILCKAIGSKLRINMEFDSENGGKECIQIRHLEERMRNEPYKNESSLRKKFKQLYCERGKGGTFIQNLRIYTIMDTDDSPKDTVPYKTGNLFSRSPFKNNIVPIFNTPCLDDVMIECGYVIDKNEKTGSYNRVFEGRDTDEVMEELLRKLRECKNTNLEIFLEDCFHRAPGYQNKI